MKIAIERDFPSLRAEEKQIDGKIGRVPSPGLTTAIQSLPIGNTAVMGGPRFYVYFEMMRFLKVNSNLTSFLFNL